MVQLSDILQFLSRHPSIRKLLLLDGIYLSPSPPSSLPTPILPNLEQVVASPAYLQWLLRDENQCPELKEITLLTGFWYSFLRPLSYDLVDTALENVLLPRSHKLETIGLCLTREHPDLDAWLQSHVSSSAAGGPNAETSVTRKHILPKFVHTKHLRIDSVNCVNIVDPGRGTSNSQKQTSPSRLELIALFAGLFPNLEYLELPGIYSHVESRIPPIVDAIRQHCPQVKKLKIGYASAKDMDQYGQSGSGNVVDAS
ncbi:hypothetical protein H1R20_g15359, partial [Candolleomyces eurysporus]